MTLYIIHKGKNILSVSLFFILFLIGCKSEIIDIPKAENGTLDLSEWNFKNDGTVKLDGEWEFYWNSLIDPLDSNISVNKNLILVPKLWNKQIVNGTEPGSNGYATYKLKVLLPDSNKIYSLKINRIESAYKIWIDNVLLNEIGKVATSGNEMQARWLPTDYTFQVDKNFIDVTIQVCNFKHKKGGIDKSIKIGTSEQISQKTRISLGFEIFILGALLIMAIYHFGLFFLRKEDKSTLFFGLAALSSAIYTTVNGEFLFPRLFPDFIWEIIVKANYITNYLRICFFVLFIGSLFRKEIPSKIPNAIVGFSLFMISFVIVTPARIYTHTLPLFFLVTIVAASILIYTLILASYRKRDGAMYSLIGTFILFLTSINDMLFDMGVINSMYLFSFGMFIFVFFQSFMLSVRSANSFKSVETLTDRLLLLDKIKKELLSIPSSDLGRTLQILHSNFNSNRALLFISNENDIPEIEIEVSNENIVYQKQNNVLTNKILFNEEILKRSISDEKDIIKNKNGSTDFSVISAPIFENQRLKALLYFEKNGNGEFENKTVEVIRLLKSQIANIIDNAFTYYKLEDLNRNLEFKVEQRTAELNHQKLEIEQKNVDMDEMIEELKVNNEIIQSINEELNTQKTEIENKNIVLEKQKVEIYEKHEELLQQQEEILTINEMLEKRQLEILNKNQELEIQKEEITRKSDQITDSIEYARRIQLALLKSDKNIPFKEHFIFYKPRDIVSGDFYWIKKFFNYTVLVAADCTGHGVPGAFMSMLGISFLNEVVNKHFRKSSKTRLSASVILDDLRESIIKALSHKDEKSQSKDGLDISLCLIDTDNNLMQFAAAYNPAYIVRENNLIELIADKMPIGVYIKDTYPFKNQEFQLLENDRIYLFSDGYIDQFGGGKGHKFLKNRFKEMLIEINLKPMNMQFEILENSFLEWKGHSKQTDDILVMGFLI